ncbi:hypothetical protein H4R33_004867, partial [Dimargaris cristalligena]
MDESNTCHPNAHHPQTPIALVWPTTDPSSIPASLSAGDQKSQPSQDESSAPSDESDGDNDNDNDTTESYLTVPTQQITFQMPLYPPTP